MVRQDDRPREVQTSPGTNFSTHTYEARNRGRSADDTDGFQGRRMSQLSSRDTLMPNPEQDDPMKHVTTKGKTVFFGKQIYQYDFDDVTSMSSLFYWNGTILRSSSVWEKLGTCLCGAAFAAGITWVMVEDAANLTTTYMFQICVYLNMLTAFLLGFYLSTKIHRWWIIRDTCIGGLRGAIGNLMMIASVYLGEDDDDFKHLILRYALLSHALVYIQAQKRNDDLQDLMVMDLITKDEFKTLTKLPPQAKAEAVWIWLTQIFNHLIFESGKIPKPMVKNIFDTLFNGRDCVRKLFSFIDTQLPLPYTHLLSITVHITHAVLAIVCGTQALIACLNNRIADLVLQFIILSCFCILYQGILVIGVKIENPLGFDTVDFPRLKYHLDIKESSLSFIRAGKVRPFMNAGIHSQFE